MNSMPRTWEKTPVSSLPHAEIETNARNSAVVLGDEATFVRVRHGGERVDSPCVDYCANDGTFLVVVGNDGFGHRVMYQAWVIFGKDVYLG